ncbi:uncharacterized protein BHQ10_007479 [Talaromyces amestolkiae]|uniref:F-box domain-containing protein n=1 Tax=Talaromyces amestolkiae TaxID=1196081 RepID=A0A364L6M9_TALAM|nr:uncharacterized protein BHQ10_007479 [Talaromyces amestolkiae]RAO71467.1 hypothetical protein BHQ10_007479 [Talaromyces amestolkiae]
MMMSEPGRINYLADELLGLILSFLIADAEFPDGREILQDYAFPPYNNKRNGTNAVASRGERTDLDRFSAEGFRRLNELVDMQQAHHTRYFTYMVRPYYQGRDWERFLAEIARDYPTLSEIHTARLADQTSLVKNARDILSLKRALVAFTSLQQIKLLRLQDRADEDIMERARRFVSVRDVKLDWEPACSRAIEGLALALMGSSCQSVRFLGPQLSPEAALKLLNAPRVTMSALGERLTCLDIYFHSASDVTALMSKLSTTFKDFFQAARNLVTINVGFPADRPLNLHLEDVFHHIHWPRLRSLGIQGWRLHSSEISAIARRHQSQLRELRLPYVYLLDGSRWRDVLSILHDDMERLEKLNLQHINYASHFNTEIMNGIEIPPGSTTDEDEQRDEDDDTNPNGELEPSQSDTDSSSIASIHDSQSEISSETEESYRQQHRYPYRHHHHQRDLQTLSEQELSMLTANDLGDNGIYVKREHWHIWEKWVVISRRRL